MLNSISKHHIDCHGVALAIVRGTQGNLGGN